MFGDELNKANECIPGEWIGGIHAIDKMFLLLKGICQIMIVCECACVCVCVGEGGSLLLKEEMPYVERTLVQEEDRLDSYPQSLYQDKIIMNFTN